MDDFDYGFLYSETDMPKKYLDFWLAIPEFKERLNELCNAHEYIGNREIREICEEIIEKGCDYEGFDKRVAENSIVKMLEHQFGLRNNGLGFLFYVCDMQKQSLKYLVNNKVFSGIIKSMCDAGIVIGNKEVLDAAVRAFMNIIEAWRNGKNPRFHARLIEQGIRKLSGILYGSRDAWLEVYGIEKDWTYYNERLAKKTIE